MFMRRYSRWEYGSVTKVFAIRNWYIRSLSAHAQAQVKVEGSDEVEWKNAKPYSSIPGPSKVEIIKAFMPGGKFHKLNFLEVNNAVYKEYGPILKFPYFFGSAGGSLFIFDPKDMETIFRVEGQYPMRKGLETSIYYRKTLRADVFKSNAGLVNDQGEAWFKFRSAVNPILMKPKVVNAYIPDFDSVAKEFVEKIKTLRDDKNEMPDDFQNELFNWALESISLVALDKRLGLIKRDGDPENQIIINAVRTNLALSYKLDVEPSLWKYVRTPTFNRLMNSLDVMTNVSKKQIERAIERLGKQTKGDSTREQSVLEKILQIDSNFAMVMSLDMLSAGIHSTVATTAGLLYNLAINQRAQDKLRKEVMKVLPNPETPITTETLNSLPYMRACFKESMRVVPVFSANFRGAGRDVVLQGYQVPKGTDVLMCTGTLNNHADYVDRPTEFIPERFLKNVPSGCPNAKDIHPFLLLPFGFGPRYCVGKRFAETEIEILLIRFLRKYKIEWNYGPMKYVRSLVINPATYLKYKITDL